MMEPFPQDDDDGNLYRRSVQRTSSTSSLSVLPQTSRRDSLFAASSSDNELDCGEEECGSSSSSSPIVLSALHLYPTSEPRRRFARRNAYCQFQMLQDAVQTSILLRHHNHHHYSITSSSVTTDTEANHPQAPDFTASAPARTRKLLLCNHPSSLPILHEESKRPGVGNNAAAEDDDCGYYAALSEAQSRKLSRTFFRSNPSNDVRYTEESSL